MCGSNGRPRPADEYLDDRTAFDVFIEYEGDGDHAGFIGIEVKLTEPFSQHRYDKPTYRRWMTLRQSLARRLGRSRCRH